MIGISAGNHAQALAWGAAREGIDCLVVMWEGASEAKIAADPLVRRGRRSRGDRPGDRLRAPAMRSIERDAAGRSSIRSTTRS